MRECPVMALDGQRFGRLHVLEFAFVKDRAARWLCLCDCGTKKVVPAKSLRSGAAQSCGCLRKERAAIASRAAKTTHGETAGSTNSRTYRIWVNMVSRCTNPRFDAFPWYGGRGIQVCDRWKLFANFLEDMGRVPDGLSIDRIDSDGDYEPSNCRWADMRTQQNNRRSSKRLEWAGRTQTQAQWARELGIDEKLISARLIRGWSLERAFGKEAA